MSDPAMRAAVARANARWSLTVPEIVRDSARASRAIAPSLAYIRSRIILSSASRGGRVRSSGSE